MPVRPSCLSVHVLRLYLNDTDPLFCWMGSFSPLSGRPIPFGASLLCATTAQQHLQKSNQISLIGVLFSTYFNNSSLSLFMFLFPYRYLLQHHAETQDALLHGQLDHSLRRHFLPLHPGLLPAGRFRRESGPLHQHPPVADHVLPPHLGDHPVHVAGRPAARQVPPIHHVPRRLVRPHHHRHPQHALPQTVHAQNGAVGPAHLHPPAAKDSAHAGAQASQRGSRGAHEGPCLLSLEYLKIRRKKKKISKAKRREIPSGFYRSV